MTALQYNTTGNLSGVAGTAFSGTALCADMSYGGANKPRPGTLTAEVAVTPLTASLAVYLKWQVSDDQTTWIDCATSGSNAAPVAVATGTTTKTTKAIQAPEAVYAYPYARAVLYSGGATGTGGDAVGIGYRWQKPIGWP
jgi:hypothetical protein